MSGNVIAPLFKQTASIGDIVGFNLQNNSASSLSSSYITFGQEFADGALSAGSALVATINGVVEAVQVDPKTFYSDGSIQMAVLTLRQPTVSAGTTLQGMLSAVPPAAQAAQPSVDLLATLVGHSLQCGLSFSDGTSTQVDLIAALRAAVANGSASTWLSGSQATQLSVSIPVAGSLRLAATFTANADGTFSTNVSFNNDIAMSTAGGAVTYSASIVQDGTTVFSQPTLTQYQYQDWNTTVYGGGGAAQGINVQHDPAYLEQIGAIPNFNLANGVAPSVIQSEAQAVSSPGWDKALSTNSVTTYMPTTGGRGDIGPTTQGNAAWLITQDPTAAAYALGQADTANAVPWNMWVPSTKAYLNTNQAADIWTDGRGGPGSYTTGLTQQVDSTDSGWTTDPAHQPDLSYYSYMMTGNQAYLNSLNAQASWTITDTWPADRGSSQIIVNGEQIRQDAWSLREVDEASYANPLGSAEGQYFTQIANVNWSWLVSQIPTWTALQGQAYGQVEGYYGGGSSLKIAPWEQDYFASTAIQAAEHGNGNALTFLNWESNFLVGRFLQSANGFNPSDGIIYNLDVGQNGTRYATWSQIEAGTIAAGDSNGTGWVQSNGDYGELALQSLAGIITLTGSANAIQAYNWLITSGAPYTDAQSRAKDAQFDIGPKLGPNLKFAANGTIINADGSSLTTNTPATTTPTPTPTPVAVAAPIPTPTVSQTNSGSSSGSTTASSSLVLNVSEDAWQGDAQFSVTVDGQPVGGTYTATASHGAGQTQAITLPASLTPGAHSIGITFLNDAYGGTTGTDRNLYLDSATYNGTPVAGSTLALYSNGSQGFGVPVTPIPTPTVSQTNSGSSSGSTTASSSLVLNVSEDAWQGDAQFSVTVDGQPVGGTYTATASHGAGQTQAITLPASLTPGAHSIGITFLNDAYGGTTGTDRNLYLDSATYNGTPVAGSTLALYSNGSQGFGVPVTPIPTPTVSQTNSGSSSGSTTASSSLVLNVSEDAWQGDAQFSVTVDGQPVGGTYTATASHGAGQTQAITLPASLTPGAHSIGITFLNDAYGGTTGTDRNLYLDSATYNGTPVAGSTLALYSNGSQGFGVPVTPIPTPTVSQTNSGSSSGSTTASSSLVLNVSEDAWQGDAQFSVMVDGQQVGGAFIAAASHGAGQTQAFTFPTSLPQGAHSIGITFLNDAYGGTAGTDRNLYLDSATYNGTPVAGSALTLASNGTQDFTLIAGALH